MANNGIVLLFGTKKSFGFFVLIKYYMVKV